MVKLCNPHFIPYLLTGFAHLEAEKTLKPLKFELRRGVGFRASDSKFL
jgi:hypothetical protein